MSSPARTCLIALLALVGLCAGGAARAQAAGFGVQPGSFQVELQASGGGAFTQAAGHPSKLSARFAINTEAGAPAGALQRLTLNLPQGLVLDPQAAGAQCQASAFEGVPEHECAAESRIGSDELVIFSGGSEVTVHAGVWELVPASGLPAELGVYIPAGGGIKEAAHLYLEGHISPVDYHEYLTLEVPSGLELSSSLLRLEAEAAHAAALLTLPSGCASAMSWGIEVRSTSGASEAASFQSTGVTGCGSVDFAPTLSSNALSSGSEQPDDLEMLASLPEDGAGFSPDIARESLTLPAGLTLNLAALPALEACSATQAALGREEPSACPAASQIGSAAITTPILPEAVTGALYLAGGTEPISGGPITMSAQYPIYLELENKRYGTSLRLKGTLTAARSDGRLEVSFEEAPQLPLGELALTLGGASSGLLANPLACGSGKLEALLTPYTTLLSTPALSNFSTTGCPTTLPFDPTQTVSETSSRAAAATSYTVSFARATGQQYLSAFTSALPKGLLPRFAGINPCRTPAAPSSTCGPANQVGVASIEAGAGAAPVTLTGDVYLNEGQGDNPYGLALVFSAALGSFNLAEDSILDVFGPPGAEVLQIALKLKTANAQVVLEGALPRTLGGVPLRIRRVSLDFNRASFLYNPTACATYHTLSTLTGFTPDVSGTPTRSLSSASAISDCGALAVKPAVAASSAKAAAAGGANLETSVTMPAGDSNARSLLLQLPHQFKLRAGTLAHACPEATFRADASACPAESFVGGASVSTPMLGAKLTGPAVLALNPQTKLPELFLVLTADGVHLDLEGSFRSAGVLTFLAFASLPDMPISKLTLSLPSGSHSALAFVPRAGVCPLPLVMPTIVTAWNKKTVRLAPTVRPVGCGVRIVGHKVIGDTVYLTAQTFAAGRISGSGSDLSTTYRHLSAAKRAVALLVPLSARGRRSRRPLRIRLRVGFVPAKGGARSSAFVTVKFP